ncbi:thiol reductant ABC exporter subunit CydD [Nocardioides sp. C4-1]|uniref:thiol reductant ABC exporter subunit CydD n=1 Tax=Nocardioides sp. C4-1 TaxID=3151851 RepID=UPI003266CECB
MRALDRRVLPHLRPARWPLGVVVAANVVAALLVVAQAFAVAALVVALVADGSWTTPAVAVVAVMAARAATSVVVDVAAARAATRVGSHLRHTVVSSALRLDAGALARHRVGELGLLATRGVAAVEPYLTRYLPALVLAGVLPVLTLVAIATQDLWAALVVVLTLPLVPLFAALIGLTTQERVDRQWRLLGQLSGHFVDVVRGLPTLVAHRRARAQSAQVAGVTDRYRRANRDVLRLAFASSAALELIATLSVALVAVLVGLRLAAGGLDLETALVVLLLAPEAYWPLRRVGAEFHAAAEGTATFEAIHELTSRAVVEPVVASGPLTLVETEVTWPGRDQPAVGPVSLSFPERGLVALTGPSGSGKSTLLAALAGEVPVSAGVLRVPAADVTSWRTSVALLEQRPWLLDATVAVNVRLGRPSATAAEVATALRRVGLDVAPDHRLSEDGAGLSAGQRARLALARVLVSDRPYVLLDEPTAHLDHATEALVLDVVRDLARTRCVVVVAHRDAVVEAADVVVPLPARARRPVPPGGGRVPEAGPRTGARHTTPTTDDDTPVATARTRLRLAGAVVLAVLAATSGVALTATAGWLIVRSSEHPPVLMLMVAIVGVRTFGLARPVLRYVERLITHDVALRELARRRVEVYDALVPLVPGRLGGSGRRRGEVLAAVVDDVDAEVDDLVRVRLPLLTWLGTTVLVTLLAVLFDPAAALVLAAVGLVAGAVALALGLIGSRRHGARRVAARAAVSDRVLAALQDARPLVRWQATDDALVAIDAAGEAQSRGTRGTAAWLAAARAWPVLVGGVGMVAVAAVSLGHVSGPVLALLVLAPLALAEVAAPAADAGALRHETRAATTRLDALGAAPPAVVDPAHPTDLPPGSTVLLREVTAAWDDAPALRPTSLEVAPGRAVGVVGPSGCGKSTLAAVLVRFLAPASGEHRLGGVDVAHLAADDVRRRVGLLDDDPYLFATSLLENVRLARPGASDADVDAALRAAQLGPWLDELPDGVRTRLGDGAAAVSGGERARIGLARLLLAEHDVLVLDEPTAHLDHATADAVSDHLLALREAGRGLVWITHTAHGLDRVDAVLDLAAPGRTSARLQQETGRRQDALS